MPTSPDLCMHCFQMFQQSQLIKACPSMSNGKPHPPPTQDALLIQQTHANFVVKELTWMFCMLLFKVCACAQGRTTFVNEDSEVRLVQFSTQKPEEPLVLANISLCVNGGVSSDSLPFLEFCLYVFDMIFKRPVYISQ
jgi:hypothetical protein